MKIKPQSCYLFKCQHFMLTSICIQSKDRKLDFLPHDTYEAKRNNEKRIVA